MKPIFIAGTDTGAGKTIVAGALASALRIKGLKTGVMKPVSCGGTDDIEFLMRCAGIREPLDIVNPIALKNPLSPNVAASFEHVKIDLKKIDTALRILRKKYEVIVIEGCGGLLVPIREDYFVIDLIKRMNAQAILVSRARLGAINHSLLSLEALKKRKIIPAGVIFNRLNGGPLSIPEKTNPAVVFKISGTPSLGLFPYMKLDCNAGCFGKAFLKHIDFKKILC